MQQLVDEPEGISFQEFLVWEFTQAKRHELVNGRIVAFAGGTIDHGDIGSNVVAALRSAVKLPCRAHGSDIIIETANRTRQSGLRADAVISCDPADRGKAKYLRTPRIIVEVLSPSNTEAEKDWRDKIIEYRVTRSIRQIVLIESESRRAESFLRGSDGEWLPAIETTGEGFVSFEVGVAVSLDAIYHDTSLQ